MILADTARVVHDIVGTVAVLGFTSVVLGLIIAWWLKFTRRHDDR